MFAEELAGFCRKPGHKKWQGGHFLCPGMLRIIGLAFYCFKNKKAPCAKRAFVYLGDNRTRLPFGNLLLPLYRPASLADGGILAAFSSLWSALLPLRVLKLLTFIALKIKKLPVLRELLSILEIIGLEPTTC